MSILMLITIGGHPRTTSDLVEHPISNKNKMESPMAPPEDFGIPSGTENEWIMCGKNPQQADLTLAQLANDVYSPIKSGYGSFRCLTDSELCKKGIDPHHLEDKATGFRAALYKNSEQVVVAFSGTNDIHDVMTDFRQALGLDDVQYKQAVALAKDAKRAFGAKLVITGHSLGGGLAAAAGLASNTFAVTFNAAGLSKNTLKGLGFNPREARLKAQNGDIRSYNEQYDLLTKLQESTSLPKAVGCKIQLKNVDTLSKNIARNLTAHTLVKTLDSMWAERLWEREYG